MIDDRFKDFHLPPPWPEDLRPLIRRSIAARRNKLVVLDDDPTGTQTVHDVPVLTEWSVASLRAEFENDLPCFYVLTNSRSQPAETARAMNLQIAQHLRLASDSFTVVSRSDSTLRGHFPIETDALTGVLGPFDATLLIPYFEAGGRFTLGDVHYVAEGDSLVPAAETAFARDATFGYRHSNLREWVEEKTGGRVKAAAVHSLSLELLRTQGPLGVAAALRALPPGGVCVVNAAALRDVEVFAAGSLQAEQLGGKYLYRTAAQFVSARLGIEAKPLLDFIPATSGGTCASRTPQERGTPCASSGGLIVVGSYVPKTTGQLEVLLQNTGDKLARVELSVPALLNETRRESVVSRALEVLRASLAAGCDAVLFTSRELVTGANADASLRIGALVSAALVGIVRRLDITPRFLVAKGGITSSDLATQSLGVKRAMVRGQVLPGIPVWELGAEARFPGLNYVVFPGNVGGPDALLEVYRKLAA
jgi:uncharacterized protein YgbK (DUF1537 family)